MLKPYEGFFQKLLNILERFTSFVFGSTTLLKLHFESISEKYKSHPDEP